MARVPVFLRNSSALYRFIAGTRAFFSDEERRSMNMMGPVRPIFEYGCQFLTTPMMRLRTGCSCGNTMRRRASRYFVPCLAGGDRWTTGAPVS
jgi:hypothetical protein